MGRILAKTLSLDIDQEYIPHNEIKVLMDKITTDFGGKGYSSTNYQFTYFYEHEFLIEPLVGDGIHLPNAEKALRHALIDNKNIIRKFIKDNGGSEFNRFSNISDFRHLLNIYDEGRFEVKDRKICAHGEVLQIGVGWEPKHHKIYY